jgi:branched-chain amino acid transport system permease protein
MNALSTLWKRPIARWTTGIVIAIVLLSLPHVLPVFGNQTMTRIMVFAVAALGVNIVMGYAGQVSLGHSFFVGLGAYAAILPIYHWWGGPLAEGAIVIGFLLAILIPGVVGLVVALAAARLRGLGLAMVTIALPIIGVPLARRYRDLTNGEPGLSIQRLPYEGADGEIHRGNAFAPPAWTGLDLDQWQYYIVLALASILFTLATFLVRGKYGRAFAQLKANESVAGALGISPYRYKVLAFTISAAFGGAAGFLFVVAFLFTNDATMGFVHSIELVVATIVGGAGTIVGSILAGAFYVLVPQLTNANGIGEWTLVIQGTITILILFLLPGGLARLPRAVRRVTAKWRGGSHVGRSNGATPTSRNTEIEITSKERQD